MPASAAHIHAHGSGMSSEWILAAPFVFAAIAYTAAAMSASRRGRAWSWGRSALWIVGVAAAAAGFIGPLADAAHGSFTAHMATHLLVGMVAPLCLAAAAPATLAMRSLSSVPARRLSRLLRSGLARVLTHPLVAASLSVGGMWLLYLSPVYPLMQRDMLMHLIVMLHVLFAGYLYTVALVPFDPSPHRAGFVLRGAVLVASLAAHGVLAKLLYVDPPPGVTLQDAHAGAQLMFYGGDAVELVLIVLLCAEWYRVSGRRLRRPDSTTGASARSPFAGERDGGGSEQPT